MVRQKEGGLRKKDYTVRIGPVSGCLQIKDILSCSWNIQILFQFVSYWPLGLAADTTTFYTESVERRNALLTAPLRNTFFALLHGNPHLPLCSIYFLFKSLI